MAEIGLVFKQTVEIDSRLPVVLSNTAHTLHLHVTPLSLSLSLSLCPFTLTRLKKRASLCIPLSLSSLRSAVATLQSSVRRVRSENADPHHQIRAKSPTAPPRSSRPRSASSASRRSFATSWTRSIFPGGLISPRPVRVFDFF